MSQKNTSLKEIVRYLIAGLATTAINWLFYTFFIVVLHLDITLSNALSWLFAVLFAFGINKIYVFQSKKKSKSAIAREMFAFFLARAVTGLIEIFLPALLISLGLDQALLGLAGSLAKAITTLVVIILNYVFSKYFVFVRKGEKKSA